MPNLEPRMEKMLFNFETTYKSDFRCGNILPPTFTTYKSKPTVLRIRPPPISWIHTLTPWMKEPPPFHLMHRPRPIVQTDPNKPQEPFEKLPDTGRAEAIKTRPRVVMTPAISPDDITDPRTRDILCDYMYTSCTTRANREAVASYSAMKAPLSSMPAPANPITLPKLNFPYVSPEWRMDSAKWDRRQLRGYCDPDKEFWTKKKAFSCGPCKEAEIVQANRKLRHQMKTGRRG